jgi:hypothetical protein
MHVMWGICHALVHPSVPIGPVPVQKLVREPPILVLVSGPTHERLCAVCKTPCVHYVHISRNHQPNLH